MAQPMSFTGKAYGISLLLLLLLLCSLRSQAAPSAANSNGPAGLSDQVVEQLSENDLYTNKRAWQSLQSSWGKRSDPAALETDDSIYVTGHFVPLVITDGANTIDWNSFERMVSNNADQTMAMQQQQQQLQQQQQQQQAQQSSQSNEELDSLADGSSENSLMEKRAWKNMNVAWGKRRQAQGWNKFRGAWGKREPTWNNLKGMWGKRDQWQKLHGGWGKRSLAN